MAIYRIILSVLWSTVCLLMIRRPTRSTLSSSSAASDVYKRQGHSNRVFSLKFINDHPEFLISAGADKNIFFWDLRSKHSVNKIFGPKILGDSLDYKNNQPAAIQLTIIYKSMILEHKNQQLNLTGFIKIKQFLKMFTVRNLRNVIRIIFWLDVVGLMK
eukprot:TRINITY_DN30863_c0_g1_i1.p2 TRINITY_DN30863_c0_g1~~TRINITY_DN30863_c0_g1_i1.p2  ORF type:complete len:159 (-),score=17.78 TRINITY_DN30863_c0_g1_i1:179-655(-)